MTKSWSNFIVTTQWIKWSSMDQDPWCIECEWTKYGQGACMFVSGPWSLLNDVDNQWEIKDAIGYILSFLSSTEPSLFLSWLRYRIFSCLHCFSNHFTYKSTLWTRSNIWHYIENMVTENTKVCFDDYCMILKTDSCMLGSRSSHYSQEGDWRDYWKCLCRFAKDQLGCKCL